MKYFDHILIKVFSFIILIITVILLIFGFGFFQLELYEFLDHFYMSAETRLIYILFLLLLAGLCLRFLLLGTGNGAVSQTINLRTDLGETRISIQALENIASKFVQKVPGVREWQVRLRISEVEGHQYFVKIIVDGEVPLPELTEQIQRELKANVERIAGIEINKVFVMVSDISSSTTARTRRVE